MTRILAYNILVGASHRLDLVEKIIRSAQPDVVGLVEATDPVVVEELARRLHMHFVMSAPGTYAEDWQVALLSRFPIVSSQVHHRNATTLKPILEACVQEPGGQQLTLFVVHLTAAFRRLWAGDGLRRREVRALLDITAAKQAAPHLIMGDFNALAPGDAFIASRLLLYILELDRHYADDPQGQVGQPHLDFVLPGLLAHIKPLIKLIPRSKVVATLFDTVASAYARRGSIALLHAAGYIDCFRHMHPGAYGFTCPAAAPAGRIDFIFASPELAARLSLCEVITPGDDASVLDASDHFPVVADFGAPVARQHSPALRGQPAEAAQW